MTQTPHQAWTKSDAGWWRSTLLWLTALLAFRLAALAFNRTDLMFDEAQYWAWAQEPAFGYFSKPPLLAWIIGAVTGVCGDCEFCVRLASPLLYWGSGMLIFLAAKALYDARVAFWSAIVFSTAPGASFSAAIIATDMPLLFCWSAALLAWVRLMQTRTWPWAIVLGLAIGAGLNAKYAMIYFLLCMGVHFALAPGSRWLLRDARLLAVLLLPVLLILPNIAWNAANGYITFAHTAGNANWGSALVQPDKMLKFLAEQFGVFGPILFAALLAVAWRTMRARDGDEARMLLHFSVPVLALVLFQALLSRAHANWAAVAYPAASILVTEFLLRGAWRRLFYASLGLHLAGAAAIAALNWAVPVLAAPDSALPGSAKYIERMRGWRELATAVRERADGGQFGAIVTDDRWVTAELLYYLRDLDIPVRSWAPVPVPRDHFELTRPFTGREPGPYLLVTLRPRSAYITDRFDTVLALPSAEIAAGPKRRRRVHFFSLDSYRGMAASGR